VQTLAAKPARPYAYELDDAATPAVTYAAIAANQQLPWPMDVPPGGLPDTMDNTKTVVINQITPIPVLSYSITGNTNSTGVTASIEGNNLEISGQTVGQDSEITVLATDLDGNPSGQTFTVHIAESFLSPDITQAPAATTKAPGATATFSVQATGNAPLSYQWRKDGVNLPGQTGDTLILNNVSYGDQGAYSVEVRNCHRLQSQFRRKPNRPGNPVDHATACQPDANLRLFSGVHRNGDRAGHRLPVVQRHYAYQWRNVGNLHDPLCHDG